MRCQEPSIPFPSTSFNGNVWTAWIEGREHSTAAHVYTGWIKSMKAIILKIFSSMVSICLSKIKLHCWNMPIMTTQIWHQRGFNYLVCCKLILYYFTLILNNTVTIPLQWQNSSSYIQSPLYPVLLHAQNRTTGHYFLMPHPNRHICGIDYNIAHAVIPFTWLFEIYVACNWLYMHGTVFHLLQLNKKNVMSQIPKSFYYCSEWIHSKWQEAF